MAVGSMAWVLAAFGVVAAQLPPPPTEGGQDTQRAPRLVVAQRKVDLGTVIEGDKVTALWHLENTGDADLVIERTKAGCGCTAVKLAEEEKTVAPGKSLELKAVFDSTRRRGRQNKSLTVFSNDPLEPTLKLSFTANVESLYELKPSGIVNLRAIQRGSVSPTALEILPGKGRKSVEVLEVEIPDGVPLAYENEPLDTPAGTGQRVHFTVTEGARLGSLSTKVTVRLSIDGIERTRTVAIRGEVVGDLTILPRIVDATRHKSGRGKRLAPVTVRSTNAVPFEILEVTAGPLFDVSVEPDEKNPKKTRYQVHMTVRDDSPAGPFGATLEIRTSSLDQPVVRVPVFGIVAPVIEADPPLIVLRQDGTPVGAQRRVKVQVSLQERLQIRDITCENSAVVATVDQPASSHYRHLRFLDVRLVGKLPPGTYDTVLRLTTSVKGAEQFEIPVVIQVPE